MEAVVRGWVLTTALLLLAAKLASSTNHLSNCSEPERENILSIQSCFSKSCLTCKNVPANCTERRIAEKSSDSVILDCTMIDLENCFLQTCPSCRLCSTSLIHPFDPSSPGGLWNMTSFCAHFPLLNGQNCSEVPSIGDTECRSTDRIDHLRDITDDEHTCYCHGSETCFLNSSFTFMLPVEPPTPSSPSVFLPSPSSFSSPFGFPDSPSITPTASTTATQPRGLASAVVGAISGLAIFALVAAFSIVVATGCVMRHWKCGPWRSKEGTRRREGLLASSSALGTRGLGLDSWNQNQSQRNGEPQEITLLQKIGRGRYGTVWKGQYQKDVVAVKEFSHHNRHAWETELQLYQKESTVHRNVVPFICGKLYGSGSETHMYLLHPFYQMGSLNRFLRNSTVSWNQLYNIVSSVARGLSHLHSEHYTSPAGVQMEKYAIAHRDVKTPNVLVQNENGECVLSDLGLAFVLDPHVDCKQLANAGQVGTYRYMAPEALDARVNLQDLESFKQIDVYALGLVIWEVAWRCEEQNEDGVVPSYQAPFQNVVGERPSLEAMREVVITEEQTPPIPSSWRQHFGLRVIANTIEECLDRDPEARLTAANVVYRIEDLGITVEVSNDRDNLPADHGNELEDDVQVHLPPYSTEDPNPIVINGGVIQFHNWKPSRRESAPSFRFSSSFPVIRHSTGDLHVQQGLSSLPNAVDTILHREEDEREVEGEGEGEGEGHREGGGGGGGRTRGDEGRAHRRLSATHPCMCNSHHGAGGRNSSDDTNPALNNSSPPPPPVPVVTDHDRTNLHSNNSNTEHGTTTTNNNHNGHSLEQRTGSLCESLTEVVADIN